MLPASTYSKKWDKFLIGLETIIAFNQECGSQLTGIRREGPGGSQRRDLANQNKPRMGGFPDPQKNIACEETIYGN